MYLSPESSCLRAPLLLHQCRKWMVSFVFFLMDSIPFVLLMGVQYQSLLERINQTLYMINVHKPVDELVARVQHCHEAQGIAANFHRRLNHPFKSWMPLPINQKLSSTRSRKSGGRDIQSFEIQTPLCFITKIRNSAIVETNYLCSSYFEPHSL